VVFSLCFFRVCTPLTLVFSRFARRRQDLERRAWERYDTLDRLDAELNRYWGQYNALDALVEALRTPDWLLVPRRSRGGWPSSLKVVGRLCPHCLSISIRVVWLCNEQLLVRNV
jgi:hypothetical protein